MLVQYLEMYKRSIEDPAGFWSDIASQFYWKQKWGHPVYSENFDIRKGRINIEVIICHPFAFLLLQCSLRSLTLILNSVLDQWFKGGITNICYNCLDTNIAAGNGEKIAIYWEGNEPGVDASLTYNQLLQKVCQVTFPFALSPAFLQPVSR